MSECLKEQWERFKEASNRKWEALYQLARGMDMELEALRMPNQARGSCKAPCRRSWKNCSGNRKSCF